MLSSGKLRRSFTVLLVFLSLGCLRSPEYDSALDSDVLRIAAGKLYLKVQVQGMIPGNHAVVTDSSAFQVALSSDGTYIFPNEYSSGNAYSVALTVPSARQNCVLSGNTGNFASGDVTVQLNCTTVQFRVGGNLTGLEAGKNIEISLNGTESLRLNQNQSYWFNTLLLNTDAYAVSITSQPEFMQCSLSNASGSITGSDVANIDINCIPWSVNIVSISPNINGLINATDALTIVFSESMNIPSCISTNLSGSFTSANFGWNISNDTLTITPQTQWPFGGNQSTMLSNCQSALGKLVQGYNINFNYSVTSNANHVRFVSVNGNDTNDGLTTSTPKANVHTAYGELAGLPGNPCNTSLDCFVLVTDGTFVLPQTLSMSNGVSIYGSYSVDFTSRSSFNKTTSLVPAGSFNCVAPENAGTPCALIRIPAAVVNPVATSLDGLTVSGAGTQFSAGIHVYGGCSRLDNLNVYGANVAGIPAYSNGIIISGAYGCNFAPFEYLNVRPGDCSGSNCVSMAMNISTLPASGIIVRSSILTGGNSGSPGSNSLALQIDANSATVNIQRSQLIGGTAENAAALSLTAGGVLDVIVNGSLLNGGTATGNIKSAVFVNATGSGNIQIVNSVLNGPNGGTNPNMESTAVRIGSNSLKTTLSQNMIIGGIVNTPGSISAGIVVIPAI
ncbi:MAG: hypothetical protein KDK38_01780, partial [Leptospiraceae bacterium]|nr:hypothetical protein [Leptospiraceae bacterium]